MRSRKYIYILLLILLTGCSTKTYTVSFDTNGGTLMESIEVSRGATIEDVNLPEKEGYLFVNWLKDGVEYKSEYPVNEDITLTANWVEAPKIYEYYQVTFINGDTIEKISVKENETVTPPKEKTIENHLFLGWFSGEEVFDFNEPITKNIALTAKYELNLFTVTYELDGGIGLAIETVQKDTTLSIPPTPYKPGYKFLKWMLNLNEFSFETKITEDITLTAIWEEIEYVVVKFNTDGGTEIADVTIEKYNKLSNIIVPVKEGYTFVEWRLNEESFSLDTPIEENITLTAIYKLNEEPEEE